MSYDEQEVLESTYLNGVQTERERILEILEARRKKAVWCTPDKICTHSVGCHTFDHWIAGIISRVKEQRNDLTR